MPTIRVAPLNPDEARIIPISEGTPPRRSIIVLHDGENVRAYWNVCQHLPIPLDGGTGEVPRDDNNDLVCNTHGAIYSPDTGRCHTGPCEGANLEPLRVDRTEDADLIHY